ncbi:MAG: hypothetical protein ACTSW1_13695 [Candidatus Hodarchaeales archaeon]
MLTCLDTNVYISYMFPSERLHEQVRKLMEEIDRYQYVVWRNDIIEREIYNVTRSLQSFLNATITEVQSEFIKNGRKHVKNTDLWIIERKFSHDIGVAISKSDISKIKRLQHAEYLIIRFLEEEFSQKEILNIERILDKLLMKVHDLFFVEEIKLFKHFKEKGNFVKTNLITPSKSKLNLDFIKNRNDINILTSFITEIRLKNDRGIFVSFDQHFLNERDQLRNLFPELWIVRPLYYHLARLSVEET